MLGSARLRRSLFVCSFVGFVNHQVVPEEVLVGTEIPRGAWGVVIAQWLERRAHVRKVAGSRPGRSGGIIFFIFFFFICSVLTLISVPQ